jgi:hypothetical protein
METNMGLLQEIHKRIKAKEAEINDLEQNIQSLKMRREAAKAYIAGLQDILPRVQRDEGTSSSSAGNGKQMVFRSGSSAELVHQVLANEGAPLHVNRILEKLGKAGDKKAKLALVGTLSRYAREGIAFKKTGPNTFSLVASAAHQADELPKEFGT